MAQAKAVIEMHETFRSPAILQGADLANAFMGGRVDFANGTLEDKKVGARRIADAVRKYGENSPIPVVLHLDHGKNIESCIAAIDGGYTSVMIDGSSLPLEQNIELTREVVKYAHPLGVSVEGELGVLGGQEDHVFAETSTYTNPLDAVEFIQKTGVDALAISYGTQHGANKGKNASCAARSPSPSRSAQPPGHLLRAGESRLFHRAAVHRQGDKRPRRRHTERLRHPRERARCRHPLRHPQDKRDTDIRLAVTRNMKELFANHPELRGQRLHRRRLPPAGGEAQRL